MAERLTRRPHTVGKTSKQLLTATILVALTLSAGAQTRIEPHSNGYSPQQDVQLGQQAAAEIRQQLPMVNDRRTEDFVEGIGERLIAEIPDYLRQPAFRYSFDVVNLKDINAFALPGGPMFLHRGMIEAAKTDGEVAGVMAHELSHVILRHGTAQATKGQKFQIGAIAGQILGGIVGGRTGSIIAQGSKLGLGVYFLKYGREYEREADLLGAQIMAEAGYDPRQMANMFRTIEQQRRSSAPEWLSDHPNPGNRYEAILREAETLKSRRPRAAEPHRGRPRTALSASTRADVGTGGSAATAAPPTRASRHERQCRRSAGALRPVADGPAGGLPAVERSGELAPGG